MRPLLRITALVACLAVEPATSATIASQSGDIVTYVNNLVIPGAGSNAFVTPTDASIASWRLVVDALFSGKYQTAADLADPLNYNVVQFNDTGRNRTYYVLVERTNSQGAPLRGLGTYIFNPASCRNLSLQAPHAGGDENTRAEAATLFADLNATALLVAGTHRCANSAVSACDGSSSACGDNSFHISDVAHYTQNYFEPAHEEITKTIPNLITVAIHGEGEHTPDVILSNGTCFSYPAPSTSTLLATEYNQLFHQMGVSLSAGTCNSGAASTSLCAETDVEGRYSNNSATLCNCATPTKSACSSTLGCGRNIVFPEKFVHLEQDCQLREVQGCAVAGVGFQTAVSAFAAVFPCSPRIASVVQGASFHPDPLAPGSFFTLFGDGLGAQESAGAAPAFSLGGLTAQFCGQPARLVYNSGAGQVNGVVPVEAAGKSSCPVTASLSGYTVPATPATVTVPIVPQNIALFLYAASSSLTVPIVTNANYQVLGPPGSGLTQAQKGSGIILWATGGGLTTPLVADNALAPLSGASVQTTPVIRIAGTPATVLYAGLAPGYFGLYQINLVVPPGTPSGKVALVISGGLGDVSYDLWVQ
ncbi:MAG TPA: hypothetical protein VKU19_16765 [Bryobacteraceae bacterium]|nr:hypothetical protein [Bryobacteraceae bacterium]